MKKILLLVITLALGVCMTSCEKEEFPTENVPAGVNPNTENWCQVTLIPAGENIWVSHGETVEDGPFPPDYELTAPRTVTFTWPKDSTRGGIQLWQVRNGSAWVVTTIFPTRGVSYSVAFY